MTQQTTDIKLQSQGRSIDFSSANNRSREPRTCDSVRVRKAFASAKASACAEALP